MNDASRVEMCMDKNGLTRSWPAAVPFGNSKIYLDQIDFYTVSQLSDKSLPEMFLDVKRMLS